MKIQPILKKKHPITNYEIIEFCHDNKIPLDGLHMRDEQYHSMKNNKCYVFNIGSMNSDGTHWVAVCIKKNKGYYFDSYGLSPPNEILNWIHKNKHIKFKRNDHQIQPIKSPMCGYYVLLFLFNIMKNNESFYEFVYRFFDNNNDEKISKIFHI